MVSTLHLLRKDGPTRWEFVGINPCLSAWKPIWAELPLAAFTY